LGEKFQRLFNEGLPTKFKGKSMKFQRGHKLAKGGARPGAGRKSKQVVADRALAVKLAEERISRIFGDLIKVAEKVIKGIKRKKFYPKEHKWAGRVYYERDYDSATLRFLIERFFPPAKTTMDVNMNLGFEKLIADLEEEERREAEEKAKAEKETLH
jgi:hypothetical protein